MHGDEMEMREALARISELAEWALRSGRRKSGGDGSDDHAEDDRYEGGRYEDGADPAGLEVTHVCTPKTLPRHQLVDAARTAVEINPANAPHIGPFDAIGMAMDVSDPLRIAVLTGKYWGPEPRDLTVSFMESTPSDLRRHILEHMNAWSRTIAIRFVETSGQGKVRISREGDGYWSYLGTDILQIPANRQTMNLQGFTMRTPESEFRRVVRHETGHTLGAPHEHMRRELVARVDREKAYAYFARTQGWDRKTVNEQVLTSLNERSIIGTAPDQTSIMCYQIPGSITVDGRPIVGGADINETDYAFMGRLYPRHGGSGRYRTAYDDEHAS